MLPLEPMENYDEDYEINLYAEYEDYLKQKCRCPSEEECECMSIAEFEERKIKEMQDFWADLQIIDYEEMSI